jgi:polar amino acid transport system substrate-binding protein
MKKNSLGLIVVLVLGLSLSACSSKKKTTAAGCDPLPVKQSGVFTVAAEFPYYEPFLIGDQGNPSGYEGDMINAIAAKLKLSKVTWVNIAFDQLYAPGTKQFDVGISEITITDERKGAVDFSEPYFDANQGILVKADSKYATATQTSDLLDAKFGAEAGTTGLDYVNNQVKPSQSVSQFDTTDVTSEALKTGTIDVQVIDVPIAAGIVAGSDVPLKIVGQFVTNEQYGLALEKGSPLKACVDATITALKADGTLKTLQDKYFPGTTDIPIFQPTS